jgi:hypothetical protein
MFEARKVRKIDDGQAKGKAKDPVWAAKAEKKLTKIIEKGDKKIEKIDAKLEKIRKKR